MCTNSDKIKLCTCEFDLLDELNDYWVLHRFNKNKDSKCIGMFINPYEFQQDDYLLNQATLETRLNENDVFDKEIKFNTKDMLEIVINSLELQNKPTLNYCFIYKQNKWKAVEYDPFELMNEYAEIKKGNLEQIK